MPASAHSTTLGATAILASERVARPGRFTDSVSGAQIAYCGMPRQRMTSVVSLVCTSKVANAVPEPSFFADRSAGWTIAFQPPASSGSPACSEMLWPQWSHDVASIDWMRPSRS